MEYDPYLLLKRQQFQIRVDHGPQIDPMTISILLEQLQRAYYTAGAGLDILFQEPSGHPLLKYIARVRAQGIRDWEIASLDWDDKTFRSSPMFKGGKAKLRWPDDYNLRLLQLSYTNPLEVLFDGGLIAFAIAIVIAGGSGEFTIKSSDNEMRFHFQIPPLAETINNIRRKLANSQERNAGVVRTTIVQAERITPILKGRRIEPEIKPASDEP